MFQLSLIFALILNLSSMPFKTDGTDLQDGQKHKHFLIGFANGSSDDGSVDYYSNTLLRSLEIKAQGDIELTANDLDIKNISGDGYVMISERDWLTYRSVRFTAGPGGKVEKRYTIQGREYEFDADAQAWFYQIMQEVVRETGLGAKYRIQRILEQKGLHAAIREITYVGNNSAKQVYFQAILKHPDLSSEMLQKAVETIAEEISSSSRLGDLLISTARNFPEDSVLTESLIRATRDISSSSKQSEVLMEISRLRRLDKSSSFAMAESIRHISSSSAQGSALEALAERCSVDDEVIREYLETVKSVSSSSEQGAVLKALIEKKGLSDDAFVGILRTIEHIPSSSVQGDVLEDVAEVCPDNDRVLSAYLKAVSFVSSSSVQGRAVMAMLKKENISSNILTRTMNFAREEISSRSVQDEIVELVMKRLSKKENR